MNDLTDNGQMPQDWPPQPVDLLGDLLELLYPDPGPDILTLEDFKRRYRLTGKGPLAMAAITQAQRINRAIGNFNDIGLSEYHVGLIYFYWKDYPGAAQQFREARQQWSFVDKTASLCLAHFAEGIAQQHNFAYEAALRHFGKAEHVLPRINFEPSPTSRGQFQLNLSAALNDAQKSAREALWEPAIPLPESEQTQDDILDSPPENRADISSARKSEPITKDESLPKNNLGPLPPFSATQRPVQLASPIPYHVTTNDQYVWYRMQVQQRDGQSVTYQEQGWLLVDKQTDDHILKKGDLVVIVSDDENANVVLTPQAADKVSPRICLMRAETEGVFIFETGRGQQVTDQNPISVDPDKIIGYVVGWWARLGEKSGLGIG